MHPANRVLAQQIRWRQTGRKFGLGFKLMRGLVGQASTKYVLAKYFNPEQGPSVSPQDKSGSRRKWVGEPDYLKTQ